MCNVRLLQTTVIKSAVVQKVQTCVSVMHQWNITENPETNPGKCGQLIFEKDMKELNGERTVFLTRGTGTTGHSYAKQTNKKIPKTLD